MIEVHALRAFLTEVKHPLGVQDVPGFPLEADWDDFIHG